MTFQTHCATTVTPTPTPVPVVTPTPTPDPDAGLTTVVYSNFFNQNGFCTALSNWDANTTILVFPISSTNPKDLVFKRGKVYEVIRGDTVYTNLTTINALVLHNNSPGCTVRMLNGDFVKVDP